MGRFAAWNIRYGEWWMIQWQIHGWASLGAHVDLKRRRVAHGEHQGKVYGPYVDLHLLFLILSLGFRPYLTGELMNVSGSARGGFSVPEDGSFRIGRIVWSFSSFVELVLILLLLMNILGTYMRFKRWGLP